MNHVNYCLLLLAAMATKASPEDMAELTRQVRHRTEAMQDFLSGLEKWTDRSEELV